MTDRITFGYVKDHVREKSQLAVTARFLTADVLTAPTNVYYRLDCLTTCQTIQDWTSVSADDEVDLTLTASQNAIQCQDNEVERKQLTVAADYNLATEYRETFEYDVLNIRHVS
jgi:hypothetical protein